MRTCTPFPQKEKITVVGKILAETPNAILLELCTSYEEYKTYLDSRNEVDTDKHWFPLSQVNAIHRTFSHVNCTMDSLEVTAWIASKKGII